VSAPGGGGRTGAGGSGVRAASGARLARFALAAALAACPAPARADVAPSDSLLHSYMRSMSDTTDAWYGATAAPLDTAGLDSALAVGLAKPPGAHGASASRRGLKLEWSPALGFNRGDGAQLGAGLGVRSPLPGRLSGRAQYTTGMKDVLGEGAWGGSWRASRLPARWSFRAAAGRWTEAFDRDYYYPVLSALRAVTDGSDRHQYLRRDGFTSWLRLSGEQAYARVGWRNQLESSLPYTTEWTLFGPGPAFRFITPATPGRASELAFEGDATLPSTRFRLNAAYWTSDPRMGSDFRYRRARLTLGGDVSLGRHFSLVPQGTYGRLRGNALPQDAFFLGGPNSLQTLERGDQTGTGHAFARVDLFLVDDLHALLHLPLPAWLPLQAGTFAAIGSAWGRDPVSGAAVPTDRDWPRQDEWLSEVGAGLAWRPGLPDPLALLRFQYAFPIGPDARGAKYTVVFQHPLNLLPER
jgi:hypothetical protein